MSEEGPTTPTASANEPIGERAGGVGGGEGSSNSFRTPEEGLAPPIIFAVSDFVAVVNQSLEFAFPFVTIEGEVLECKVSKGRWVFLTLKDEYATLKCFATIYALPGPIEPGMMVRVQGSPRLHEKYGFSLQVQQVILHGEGTLRKGFELLQAKLQADGLLDPARKRLLPAMPKRVAVVTSVDSAACADFLKIAKARWGGMEIAVYDSYVQGDEAPASLVRAIHVVQAEAELPDVLVLIRGGGGAEDLSAYNHEDVVRAVATSRVPTLVAIGHEVDVCLSELVADVRASTPSNAAELLFPDKRAELAKLAERAIALRRELVQFVDVRRRANARLQVALDESLRYAWERAEQSLGTARAMLRAYDPSLPLERGYAIVRTESGRQVGSVDEVHVGDVLSVRLRNGDVLTEVKKVNGTKKEN